MSARLKKLLKELQLAQFPEDIFGDLKDGSVLESYRDWCKDTHEDLCEDHEKHIAHEAFIVLNKFYEQAKQKISDGSYGKKTRDVYLETRINKYKIEVPLYEGDISNIYRAWDKNNKQVLIKIASESSNNDLLKNEYKNVTSIRNFYTDKDDKILRHIPDFIESCSVDEGEVKFVSVQVPRLNFVTLDDIIKAFPNGIDVRDMAWMFNRCMSSLIAAHQAGYVHGAITPKHILLNPEDHNGMLIDWCYSVKENEKITAIVSDYKDFYPNEVFLKKPARTNLDIYMLAKCMTKLLGENWENTTPSAIKGLLKACLLSYTHRYQDIWTLYTEFGDILKKLYGPRKFRIFKMPDLVKTK